jgi:polar amino acid transport system substrate-binding protein
VIVAMTTAMTPSEPSAAARSELTSTGKLRAAINYGNAILATRDAKSGQSRGVAVDLTQELARRLSVPVELVPFEGVAPMVDAAKTGVWDIAFLGADPARAGEITFTAPYLELEATYLVPAGSSLRTVADVDRQGIRVAAPARAAYELFLSRGLKQAELVRTKSGDEAFDFLVQGKVEALSGLRQGLYALQEKLPGSRMLDGKFFAVQQAIGVPAGRDAAAEYLRGFVEQAKASGLVARSIEKTGFRGVSVAPRGDAR